MIANNYPQKTKMTQTLTTIGHRTAFNNEQSPCKKKYVTHKPTTTTELQAPDLGQVHT